jgi:hypothetical protein
MGFMRFDILMPAILFVVTLMAMFLNKRVEAKLKATVEDREFGSRDVVLLVTMIAVMVSVIVFVPQMAIMALFLFSYSSLLFMVSYAFSDMSARRVTLFCAGFIIASVSAGIIGFLSVFPSGLRIYGTLAFAALASSAFIARVYAQQKTDAKPRWYVAALPTALFLLLFGFFSTTPVWNPFLLDAYGVIFAILIVLYIGTLFTWKTVVIFAGFLTALDIVLVWFTGAMVTAAEHVSGLGLPVLVAFPTIPLIIVQQDILIMRLGLGDFFFAGILATQTLKKFGRKTAVLSVLTICVSFALFELLLLNVPSQVSALPATLPILLGWLPIIAWKLFGEKKQKTATIELGKN